ncbi:uncharacterized protein LOC111387447 [Olea europaea var. sylvestris]|uniref:uncharacterized protein LOC111387447 n=1 Tax=Olea europaea var. sylvestris TaxID=158386 RepID=UPI000C1D4609|nr:uncharacterized protein LOC111387447 [Olea europaea var. sylvestris]
MEDRGRLLQQYTVDVHVKIETARFDYFRNNQKVIRAKLFQEIVDSIQIGKNRGHKVGKSMVLPVVFIEGPRNLIKRYMDIMSLVESYGKPNTKKISFPAWYYDQTYDAWSLWIIKSYKYLHEKQPNLHRSDGIAIRVRGCMLDNRQVVPYNSHILAKYDCHINVEICCSVKVVKYLYKYVYKGNDLVNFTVNKETKEHYIDEISNNQTVRRISVPEAIWRIFGFDLLDIFPSVLSLQLHVEDAQLVTYNEIDDLS